MTQFPQSFTPESSLYPVEPPRRVRPAGTSGSFTYRIAKVLLLSRSCTTIDPQTSYPEAVTPDAESLWKQRKMHPIGNFPLSGLVHSLPGSLPRRLCTGTIQSHNRRDRPARRPQLRVLPAIIESAIHRHHQRIRPRRQWRSRTHRQNHPPKPGWPAGPA